MPAIGDVLTSEKGKQYQLVKQLGQGGEGTVYTTTDPKMVVKVYHPNKINDTLRRKLLCMIRNPLDPYAGVGKLLIAWPLDVVYQNGSFVGYVMPLVPDTLPIYTVCMSDPQYPPNRYTIFPNYTYLHSLLVAYHLAYAVEYIHNHGYVVGDMNSNNIAIHKDGTVTILDVDSFDITDPKTGERYPCVVGVSEFLPPELQGRNLRSAKFDKHTDEFSLAVHIFILLMNGRHPFTRRTLPGAVSTGNVQTLCQKKASVPDDPQVTNIVRGYCPYLRPMPGYDIPMGAVQLRALSANLQQGFRLTFGYNENTAMSQRTKRLDAAHWRFHLHEFIERHRDDTKTGRQADLLRCTKNPEHYYLKSRGNCPFCDAEAVVWGVSILGTNTSPTVTSSGSITEGETAYVHFRVSSGSSSQQDALKYKIDGGSLSGIGKSYRLGESGCITCGKLSSGSHTLTITDSKNKQLATASFTVSRKVAPPPSPQPWWENWWKKLFG